MAGCDGREKENRGQHLMPRTLVGSGVEGRGEPCLETRVSLRYQSITVQGYGTFYHSSYDMSRGAHLP